MCVNIVYSNQTNVIKYQPRVKDILTKEIWSFDCNRIGPRTKTQLNAISSKIHQQSLRIVNATIALLLINKLVDVDSVFGISSGGSFVQFR